MVELVKQQLIIGGETVNSVEGGVFQSTNPYNGEVWAEVQKATKADLDLAVAAARKAFPIWRAMPGVKRAELMHKLADALVENAERLSLWETTDNGKIIRETYPQVLFSARNLRFFAGYADKLYGRTIPLDNPGIFDYTQRRPHGVVALITAWNSPLSLLSNKLPPALATGNTVVIKPSEHASVTTLELGKLALEVGFPPGVINVVAGAAPLGEDLINHPGIDKISFTGGVSVGRHIGKVAADRLIPVTLELGGKSPNIIFDDCDVEKAIPGAVSGIFAAAGQTCVAGSRLLVQEGVYDQIVEGVIERAKNIVLGDPRNKETEMGPVANNSQFERILGVIDDAVTAGATLATGGRSPENAGDALFIEPTVFTGVDPESFLAQNEVFGPVLGVIPFKDEAHAIEIANGTNFGLASGIWTENLGRAHRVADALETGVVWVNTYRTSAAQAPFGGIKQSGIGRERGAEVLEEYTYVKNVMIDVTGEHRDPFVIRT